jgi:hypothetical protein
MDRRSQERTKDPLLCPVYRFVRAVQRVLRTVPRWTPNTLLCSISPTLFLTDQFTKLLLRCTCSLFGGHDIFGFHPHEIGNRSIRSGAAMSMFLQNHSTPKIMIMGRWSSDAFLVYLRPQALEWANNMSSSMINFDSFMDLGTHDMSSASNPRTRTPPLYGPGNSIRIPVFNLHNL